MKVIDAKKLVAGLEPTTAALIEPIIIGHVTGVMKGAGENLADAVHALTEEQLRVVAGHAVMFAATQAILAAQVEGLLLELTDGLTNE